MIFWDFYNTIFLRLCIYPRKYLPGLNADNAKSKSAEYGNIFYENCVNAQQAVWILIDLESANGRSEIYK